jgi:broad specificity phosphatase PhoE
VTPTPKKLLSLYLVRHGQTEWSVSGEHTGSTDIALTAHGEDEARALNPWLKRVQFGLVLTSLLKRAR